MSVSAAPLVRDVDLPSPAFVVSLPAMEKNCSRMAAKVKALGLSFRPHVKTHKTIQGALLQTGEFGGKACGIVVSTLKEAEFFADGGFENILYGVLLEPSKLERCKALAARLPAFHVLIDSTEALEMLEASPLADGKRWSVFMKVDCGYHRAGVVAGEDASVALALAIAHSAATSLSGIYSHSGNSYNCPGADVSEVSAAARAVAATESANIAELRRRIGEAGVDVAVVSVGATPSVSSADEFPGVTEVHPGNYCFFDRQQVASGSCALADVACYVIARVIGRYLHRNELLVDAGACALHKDPAGISHYGVLVDAPSMYLDRITQEAGVVTSKEPIDFASFPIGAVVRIVPNHSCMTASCHRTHYVVNGERQVVDAWTPCHGW